MRKSREQQMNRIWYEGEPAPIWMRALVPLYRQGARFDRWRKLRQRQPLPEGLSVIVVGNLTAGGAGKTPLVIRLCELLTRAGLKTGVVSRGYGRESGELRLVTAACDPAKMGDEPVLIAQRTGLPVIVAEDRLQATLKLHSMGREVVIADDGLQHYRLPRDLEICVVDGSRGFGNGSLLPAGPLRESLQRLGTVDRVVINGEQRPPDLPESVTAQTMVMAPGILRSMDGRQSWRLPQFAGCTVNAVAGIGNPARFFDLLRQSRIQVNEFPFPDHHPYSPQDFEDMAPDLPIVMTEKDAVKCRRLGLKNAWALAVDAMLPHAWEKDLVRTVLDLRATQDDQESEHDDRQ